jgi:hypothetical protein
MEVTTLSYDNLHNHGELFANMFRARHRAFIQQNKWDLPQSNGMEFDQYDTPASRWVAVHTDGEVLAGIRLTPTTHRCGIYSYMIRDAQPGLRVRIRSCGVAVARPVAVAPGNGERGPRIGRDLGSGANSRSIAPHRSPRRSGMRAGRADTELRRARLRLCNHKHGTEAALSDIPEPLRGPTAMWLDFGAKHAMVAGPIL